MKVFWTRSLFPLLVTVSLGGCGGGGGEPSSFEPAAVPAAVSAATLPLMSDASRVKDECAVE